MKVLKALLALLTTLAVALTAALLEELLKMVRDLGHDRTFEHMKYLLGCEKDY